MTIKNITLAETTSGTHIVRAIDRIRCLNDGSITEHKYFIETETPHSRYSALEYNTKTGFLKALKVCGYNAEFIKSVKNAEI